MIHSIQTAGFMKQKTLLQKGGAALCTEGYFQEERQWR